MPLPLPLPSARRPGAVLLPVLALWAAEARAADGMLARWLGGEVWSEPLDTTITRLSPWVQAGGIVLVGFFVARRARGLASRTLQRSRVDPVLRPALADAMVPLVQLLTLLAALARLGLLTDGVLALLGLSALAAAILLRDSLQKAVAGAVLLGQRPFNLGDEVTACGLRGRVEAIGLWTTRLREPSGELTLLSNDQLLHGPLRNHSRSGQRCAALRLPPIPDAAAEEALRTGLAGLDTAAGTLRLELIGVEAEGLRFQLWITADPERAVALQEAALRLVAPLAFPRP